MERLYTCQRCSDPYQWRKSSSALKMTYCGILCEQGDLGFTIEALLRTSFNPPPSNPPAEKSSESLDKKFQAVVY